MATVKDAAIGGIIGSVATVIVGVIFSSATANFFLGIAVSKLLPSNAVILVNGSDCGGGDWSKLDQAAGRFFVAAGQASVDNDTFKAGFPGPGKSSVVLSKDNIPSLSFAITYTTSGFDVQNGGYQIMRSLGGAGTNQSFGLPLGGSAASFSITPPWYGLTPCHR